MNKKEIQNFIIWYIPVIIGTHSISFTLYFSETGSVDGNLYFILSNLNLVICGVWLFINSPKHNLNKWLWGIFGLGAHLFAIVLYFGYVAFNQSLKHETPLSGAS